MAKYRNVGNSILCLTPCSSGAYKLSSYPFPQCSLSLKFRSCLTGVSFRTGLHNSACWSVWFSVVKNNVWIVFQCSFFLCEGWWSPTWLTNHILSKDNTNDILTWKSKNSEGLNQDSEIQEPRNAKSKRNNLSEGKIPCWLFNTKWSALKKYTYKKHYMAKQAVLIHKEIYTYVCKHICMCVSITTIRKKRTWIGGTWGGGFLGSFRGRKGKHKGVSSNLCKSKQGNVCLQPQCSYGEMRDTQIGHRWASHPGVYRNKNNYSFEGCFSGSHNIGGYREGKTVTDFYVSVSKVNMHMN